MRWSIAFVTMDRPAAAQRFVRSARRRFPDVPICVADQSVASDAMLEFYEAERVTVVRMPFDAGLSASRNALIDAMDVDYVALCDDDFVLGPSSSFESAIEVLEADPRLGVVGGMLHDLDEAGERIRNWEVFFDRDERHGRFTVTPIYYYPALARQVAGHTLYACDAVLNFAVCRMAMFADGLRWDDRIKINGEHEDFYLAVKTHSRFEVAYLPSMAALHQPAPRHGRHAVLRARHEGRRVFMDKWGVTSHVELGTGGRPLDGVPVEDWFVAPDGTAAGGVPLRTYTTVAPVARGRDTARAEYRSFRDWLAPRAHAGPSPGLVSLAFRYQPAVDPDGDLLLWYRPTDPLRGPGAPGGLDAVVRWSAPDGSALVWESDVHAVHADETRYWQPIAVRIPLWPRGASHLRFDVLSAEGARAPLAMGFVFPERDGDGQPGFEATADVLAWTRTTPAAAHVPLPYASLASLLADAPRTSFEAMRQGAQPLVMVDVSTMDALGIVTEHPAGPPLWLAAGARRPAGGPAHLALPLSLLRDARTVLFAIAAGEGQHPLLVLDVRVTDLPAPRD
jgi:GT2 family glycosyltransferase